MKLIKYPRTQHIYGSRIQKGDKDLDAVPFSKIADQYLVIEEKMDGANCAVSFHDGELKLQSRGHFLTGGPREKQFDLLKTWASIHQATLYDILQDRYIMYGEWLYARHTVMYDSLPHYFMEFDILDRQNSEWLSTKRRKEMLNNSPVISVKVLAEGKFKEEDLPKLITKSNFGPNLMEGLYIKSETDKVIGRYKWVRKEFLDTVQASEHWFNKPITPNKLKGSMF